MLPKGGGSTKSKKDQGGDQKDRGEVAGLRRSHGEPPTPVSNETLWAKSASNFSLGELFHLVSCFMCHPCGRVSLPFPFGFIITEQVQKCPLFYTPS